MRQTVDDPERLGAIEAGVGALVLAKLAEYEDELRCVAAQLSQACVAATLERHRLAVLRGLPLYGASGDDAAGCLAIRPLRARYHRLRALLLDNGGQAQSTDAKPPVVDLTALGLFGAVWVPARHDAPQFDGAWKVVQAGTTEWAGLCSFQAKPASSSVASSSAARPACGYRPGITARERAQPAPGTPPARDRKRKRPSDSDDSDDDDDALRWRVPSGLRAWDLPEMGVPWAAVTCPWLDRAFAHSLAEEANSLWLAETGFDTRTVALPTTTPSAVAGPRVRALRDAVRGLCALATCARPADVPLSTAAIPDFETSQLVETAVAASADERATTSWEMVADYVADLVRLVASYGRAPAQALRDELGTLCNAVVMGPSGTGKTEAARHVARVLYGCGALLTGEINEVGRHDLVAGYVGQTEAKTLSVLNAGLESLVFIDEAYSLGLSSGPEDYGNAAASVLVQFMTARENRNRIAVWAAGYKRAMRRHFLRLNEGIGSRFQVRLEWGGLRPAELVAIVLRRLSETGTTMSAVGHGLLWEGVLRADRGRGVNGNARSAQRLAALLSQRAVALRVGAAHVRDALAVWRRELGLRSPSRPPFFQ